MSRNGSGTYSKVNTFTAGNTITASGHNQNWDDIASEMTNSVAADGQTSMAGPLKHSNGSAASPSITFASDTNTGFYHSAADEMSLSLGGSQKFVISTSDVTFDGLSLGALVGEARIWALPTAPTGWVFLYGQACTTTYPLWRAALIAASNPYGTSGADPLFPDFRGYVPAGKTTMGGGADTGTLTGGNTLGNTLGTQRVTLVANEIPVITPAGTISQITPAGTVTIGGAGTSVVNGAAVGGTANLTGGGGALNQGAVTATFAGSATTPTFTGTSFGGGAAHTNTQPTIVVNFIGRAA